MLTQIQTDSAHGRN